MKKTKAEIRQLEREALVQWRRNFDNAAQDLIYTGWTREQLIERLLTREFNYTPSKEWTE